MEEDKAECEGEGELVEANNDSDSKELDKIPLNKSMITANDAVK